MKIKDFHQWAQSCQAIEAYMFTYVPSFTRSFEAVLWKDQRDQLYSSLKLYPLHHDPLSAEAQITAKNTQGPLAPTAWAQLQEALGHYGFWGDDSWKTEMGRDGAFWYFMGLRGGMTKFRECWSPDKDEPARSLGWRFFSLVPLSFCPVMTPEQAATLNLPLPDGFPVIIVY